ncbi:hypothetical protein ACUXAL_002744 [Staphylococcus saprophyticus]
MFIAKESENVIGSDGAEKMEFVKKTLYFL